MVEQKMCRLCMEKENLTSLWGRADGEKISEKLFFVCGIKVSTTDSLPKFICHECLSYAILGSRFKKKSLETEKILREQLEVECINLAGDRSEDGFDDPFSAETRESIRNKFLVYEENPDDEDQPKISYNITDTTIKIKNTKQFENTELKNFVDGYLAAKPNLEIIKVVNPDSIKEIERVIDANNESKGSSSSRKRSRPNFSTSTQQTYPKNQEQNMMREKSSIMLLSALAGQRFGNININRMSSPLFNNQETSGNNYRN